MSNNAFPRTMYKMRPKDPNIYGNKKLLLIF